MKKIILGIAIVIFLLLALGATVIFIRQRTAFFGRATAPSVGGEIALDNCYLFASPLLQTITDNLGRAIFDISSKTPAEYLVEARVGSQVLPQRVKVSFR